MCCNAADQASSVRVSPSNSNSNSHSLSPSLSSSSVTAITSSVATTNKNILPRKVNKIQANKLIMMNKIAPSQASISSLAASGTIGSGGGNGSGNLGLASGSLQHLKEQHQQQHCLGSGNANVNNSSSNNRASIAQSRSMSSQSGGSQRHNLSIENLATAAAARRNQANSIQLPATTTNRTMLLITQNQHIPQAQLDDQHSGQLFANMLNRTTRQIQIQQQQQQLQLQQQQQQPISFSSSSLNSCQSSQQQQQSQATMSQQHHLTHAGSIKVNQDSSSSALSKD